MTLGNVASKLGASLRGGPAGALRVTTPDIHQGVGVDRCGVFLGADTRGALAPAYSGSMRTNSPQLRCRKMRESKEGAELPDDAAGVWPRGALHPALRCMPWPRLAQALHSTKERTLELAREADSCWSGTSTLASSSGYAKRHAFAVVTGDSLDKRRGQRWNTMCPTGSLQTTHRVL